MLRGEDGSSGQQSLLHETEEYQSHQWLELLPELKVYILSFLTSQELQTVAQVSTQSEKAARQAFNDKVQRFLAEKMKDSQLWHYFPHLAEKVSEKDGRSVAQYFQAEMGEGWKQCANFSTFADLIATAKEVNKHNGWEANNDIPELAKRWLGNIEQNKIAEKGYPQTLTQFIENVKNPSAKSSPRERWQDWQDYHRAEKFIKQCMLSIMLSKLPSGSHSMAQKFTLMSSARFYAYMNGDQWRLLFGKDFFLELITRIIKLKQRVDSRPKDSAQLTRLESMLNRLSEQQLMDMVSEGALFPIRTQYNIIMLLKKGYDLFEKKITLKVMLAIIRRTNSIYLENNTYRCDEPPIVKYIFQSKQLFDQLTSDNQGHQDLVLLLTCLPLERFIEIFNKQHVVSLHPMAVLYDWFKVPAAQRFLLNNRNELFSNASHRALAVLESSVFLQAIKTQDVLSIAYYVGENASDLLIKRGEFKRWLGGMRGVERRAFIAELAKIESSENINYFAPAIIQDADVVAMLSSDASLNVDAIMAIALTSNESAAAALNNCILLANLSAEQLLQMAEKGLPKAPQVLLEAIKQQSLTQFNAKHIKQLKKLVPVSQCDQGKEEAETEEAVVNIERGFVLPRHEIAPVDVAEEMLPSVEAVKAEPTNWRKIAFIAGAVLMGIIGIGLMATGFGSVLSIPLLVNAAAVLFVGATSVGLMAVGVMGALLAVGAVVVGVIASDTRCVKASHTQLKPVAAPSLTYNTHLVELIADKPSTDVPLSFYAVKEDPIALSSSVSSHQIEAVPIHEGERQRSNKWVESLILGQGR